MNDQYPYYRQGRHQKQNIYRHDGPDTESTYIGVFFTPEDAKRAVEALNLYVAAMITTFTPPAPGGMVTEVCPHDCDHCHGNFCPCDNPGCAGGTEATEGCSRRAYNQGRLCGPDCYEDTCGDNEADEIVAAVTDYDLDTKPGYVWLVASALDRTSRMHAVPALAITDQTPKYRELLLDTACSPNTPRSLIRIDETAHIEFKQCVRCARKLEQDTP